MHENQKKKRTSQETIQMTRAPTRKRDAKGKIPKLPKEKLLLKVRCHLLNEG